MKLRRSVATALLVVLFAIAPFAQGGVPNRKPEVEGIAKVHTLSTHGGGGCFVEHVAFELHKIDPNFGHLKKNPGQNQFNGHAADAILYRKTGQSIDIISNSNTAKAKAAWIVDKPRYSDKDFIAPTKTCLEGQPTPVPTPTPTPTPVPAPPPVVDLTPLLNRIATLEAHEVELRNLIHTLVKQLAVEEAARVIRDTELDQRIIEQKDRIDNLTCRARGQFGIGVTCEVIK